MNKDSLPSHLHQLLESLVQDRMTPSEQQELQELLLHRRDVRDYYQRYLDLHVNLLLTGRRQQGQDVLEVPREPVSENLSEVQLVAAPRPRRWLLASLAAIAVSCAGIALFTVPLLTAPADEADKYSLAIAGNLHEGSRPQPSVWPAAEQMMLYQEAGAIFYRDQTPAVGSGLEFNHSYFLLEGCVELQSPRGARTIFNAPAAFELKSAEQLLVTYGNCSVYAPEGSEGFEVLTPSSQLIDRGTRFKVHVDELGASEVHVVEGLVDALESNDKGRGEARLEQGQARRYDAGRAALSSAIDYRADGYQQRLPDRLVRYAGPVDEAGRIGQLESATVVRGGQTLTYQFDELIGGDVVSFCERGSPATINLILPRGDRRDRHELFLHDNSFITGVLNPGGARQPYDGPVFTPENSADSQKWTPGMVVRFRAPVVNGPGPDILFFEAQTAVHPLEGDHFHVRPVELKPGYHPITVTRYEVGMLSPEAQPMDPFELLATDTVVSSLLELNAIGMRNCQNIMVNYRVVATGIDLSSMGIPEGEAISEILIQDALDDEFRVDPVLIAGLPAASNPQIPKPVQAE